MFVRDGDLIAVWFSCGAASAVAAKRVIERYGKIAKIKVVNNPIKEEHEDNRRFLRDVEQWLGTPIEIAKNPKYPDASCVDVWENRSFMSGPKGAPCTYELKKHVRVMWETAHKPDWHVLGFTADEKKRADRFKMGERSNLIDILVQENITKSDCFRMLKAARIRLPKIYELGYPNANCIGCVKATSATYWNHVRKQHPDQFKARAEQSRGLGAKLVRVNPKYLPWMAQNPPEDGGWTDTRTGEKVYGAVRIFLDELPKEAKGRAMKNMDFECGIFCEERH